MRSVTRTLLGLAAALVLAPPATAALPNDDRAHAAPVELVPADFDGDPRFVVGFEGAGASLAGATVDTATDPALASVPAVADRPGRCRGTAASPIDRGAWTAWYRLDGDPDVAGTQPIREPLVAELAFAVGSDEQGATRAPVALMVLEDGAVAACDASAVADGAHPGAWLIAPGRAAVALPLRVGRSYDVLVVGRGAMASPAWLSLAITDVGPPRFALVERGRLVPRATATFSVADATDLGRGLPSPLVVEWAWRVGRAPAVRRTTHGPAISVRWPRAGAATVTATVKDSAGNARTVAWSGVVHDLPVVGIVLGRQLVAGRIHVVVTCSRPSAISVTLRDGGSGQRVSGAGAARRGRRLEADLAVGSQAGVRIVEARCTDAAGFLGTAAQLLQIGG